MPVAEGGSWAALLVLVDLSPVQRIDNVRRDFISNVSHELRTPIAAIGALVETLELGDLEPDEQAAFLSRIRQQVERMALLTSELLDLSRIESGAIHLEPERVDLASAVAEAEAGLAIRLEACNVRIDGPGETPPSRPTALPPFASSPTCSTTPSSSAPRGAPSPSRCATSTRSWPWRCATTVPVSPLRTSIASSSVSTRPSTRARTAGPGSDSPS